MTKIIIPSGAKLSVDFSQIAELGTLDLEACVAVSARYNNHAAIMHLRQNDQLNDFFSWFCAEVPRDSSLYLVGGISGKSELFVEDIARRLRQYGYNQSTEDVLRGWRRNLWINPQHVKVEYFQEQRLPSGRIEAIEMGFNLL